MPVLSIPAYGEGKKSLPDCLRAEMANVYSLSWLLGLKSVFSENLAGYSSRLKLRKAYDGLGNMYEWQYKYGNGLNNYYDSSNGALTQRTFLHCDDSALATAINCATSSRVGPVETGGTVLNNYKQAKIIDPNGNYVVNYYYGTDADINNLGGVWNGGWEKVRDTAGSLKSSSVYTLTNVLLNKKEYNYNFIFQQVSNQNYPYGQNYIAGKCNSRN